MALSGEQRGWGRPVIKGYASRWLVVGLVATIVVVGLSQPASATGGPVNQVADTPGAGAHRGEPVVALTFDDGPDPRWTPQVLAVLRRYHVPATFFVVGRSVASRPDLVRAMADEGHSVQNHTWDHAALTGIAPGAYPHQIDDTTRVIEQATGQTVHCARPPYGALNGTAVGRLADRGLATITWTADPSDYRRPGAGVIAQRVLSATRPGGIVLMHDGGGDRSQTVAALPAVIEGLLARGLRFTTLCHQQPPVTRALVAASSGYWLVRNDGKVSPFGGAPELGGASRPASPMAGGVGTSSGQGYWLVGADGGVFTRGDASFAGSLGGRPLGAAIVGMAASPTGNGYWLVGADGGIFSFGDASFFGSLGGNALNAPIVGMAATSTGNGYWLVGADGGVFTFGDAGYLGSLGSVVLNAPIVGMATTPSGQGLWLVGADGGVFALGDAPYFGAGRVVDRRGFTGITRSPSGAGYWLVSADGSPQAFGNAKL